jgi:hypothetical protein
VIIHIPDETAIRAIQKEEGSFYWSVCCEALLRKHGIIPWKQNSDPVSTVLRVYTRGAAPEASTGVGLIEGPLSDSMLARLGVVAHTHTAGSLELYSRQDKRLSTFEYPRAELLAKDQKTGARSSPYVYCPEDRRYHKPRFGFQSFEVTDAWRPVLFASSAGGEVLPVGISNGHQLVLGIPLFDLLCALMAWPALPDGYYRMASQLPATTLEAWLLGSMRELARSNGIPWIRVATWPGGHGWACTVRTDYDRPVTDAVLRRLLALYKRNGLRATWCFLRWNCPMHQARMLHRAGHEVALHTAARTEQEFNAEIASIQLETGLELHGVTSHGGDYVGFLGDTQFNWADKAGMHWSESIGRLNRVPCRAVRIEDDMPHLGSLVLMSTHSSLDAGTGADQHYLDRVLKARKSIIAEGGHFVFMNHPDLHEPQVNEALQVTGETTPWAATFEEVATWVNGSKYEVDMHHTPGGLHAEFRSPTQFDFQIVAEDGHGRRSIQVPTGASTVKVM